MDEQFRQLSAGTQQIIPLEEFKEKLARSKKLKIKLGMDPTAPDLHLGHAVTLSKMRQFQDFGHEVIFIIGDFTARIGDPSGRSKTRPPLTDEQIEFNTKTYFSQVSKILDPARVTVRYNSEWLGKLTSKDFISLCSKVTLARIIEREDFAQRMASHQPIGFHELLYPLMQGYDSVALACDVELGGTDQTFNLLMGRHLQELWGQDPQVIMTVPLLEGLDGVAKMSKSYGNAIGLAEPADQAYGKLMSISDDLMWRYFNVLLHIPPDQIESLKSTVAAGEAHPMELKKQMASSIITRFWSSGEAEAAQKAFEELFQKRDYSHAHEVNCGEFIAKPAWIIDILRHLGAITSSSEGRRLVEAGAVTINDAKIMDFKAQVVLESGTIIKVGKHRIYKAS
jgi:tyrosyl-tRNA synthetase